ncbi:MAG: hypothetical protein ABL953_10245 [Ilumatobacteraceae bacterium]
MRTLSGLVTLLLLMSCADDNKPTSTVPSSTTPPVLFDAADCPVTDEVFCAMATEVANALAGRDAQQLVLLSRQDTIVCAEMNIEYFPGCVGQDTLTGYGLSGPTLVVEAANEADYLAALRDMTQPIDPTSVEIFGVGTCGPDVPGRRTYHLSWTAKHVDGDVATEVVGSFESLFLDDWKIVLSYFGTLEDWTAQENDPFSESFCEAGRTPWGN